MGCFFRKQPITLNCEILIFHCIAECLQSAVKKSKALKRTYMKKMKISVIAALLFGMATFTQASTLIDVNSFQLVGDVQTFSSDEQQLIANALKSYQGKGKSIQDIQQAQNALAATLNGFGKQRYQVVLPQQQVEKGNVFLQVVRDEPQQGSIAYKGGEGFDEQNVENSIPSLKEGKTLEDGRQWFDKREFNMALQNPLKVTRMHYDINPAKNASDLTVSAFSPYGKHRRFIALDNYGPREFNRARLSAGYVNANLSGNDDVLSLVGMSSVKRVGDYYALGANYQYPFYDNHQVLGVQLAYSNLDSEERSNLPQGINSKAAEGKTFMAGLNWAYYLPQLNIGVEDQLKLHAGYSYRHFDQTAALNGGIRTLEAKYSIAGVNIGLSGEIKPTSANTIEFDVQQYYYSRRLLGSSNMESVLEDGKKDYTLTTFRLGYRYDFAEGWHFNTQFSGQYTKDKLPSADDYGLTGVYGVRGFSYSGLSGDKALLWRTELATPKYTSANLNGYVFYDWGKVSQNDDTQSRTASSVGLGIRVEPVKHLNLDLFAAHKLTGKQYDSLLDGKKANSTTFWGRISYSF